MQTRSNQTRPMGKLCLSFDKLGAVGALVFALASPCCLPLFATLGGIVGLGSVPFLRHNARSLIQITAALAFIGQLAAFRQHRQRWPLLISGVSVLLMFAAYYLAYHATLIYTALTGLAAAAVWNFMIARRSQSCRHETTASVALESVISCPHCGKQSREVMPTDACLFFYDCTACGKRLKPKPGDCCVFCSYGSVKCPPVQAENNCD